MDITDPGTGPVLRPSSIPGAVGTDTWVRIDRNQTMRFLLIFLYRLHSILLKNKPGESRHERIERAIYHNR